MDLWRRGSSYEAQMLLGFAWEAATEKQSFTALALWRWSAEGLWEQKQYQCSGEAARLQGSFSIT